MPQDQNDLKEEFLNYKKSLFNVKNDLILKIKDIKRKSDGKKISKILDDLNKKI